MSEPKSSRELFQVADEASTRLAALRARLADLEAEADRAEADRRQVRHDIEVARADTAAACRALSQVAGTLFTVPDAAGGRRLYRIIGVGTGREAIAEVFPTEIE